MSKAALTESEQPSREDYERIEIATSAATELELLRVDRADNFEGLARLVEWLEAEFSAEYPSSHFLHVREALCKSGFFDTQARGFAELSEAVAGVNIIFRGIAAAPQSARRSIPTIEKMRNFCLNLSRASGRLLF